MTVNNKFDVLYNKGILHKYRDTIDTIFYNYSDAYMLTVLLKDYPNVYLRLYKVKYNKLDNAFYAGVLQHYNKVVYHKFIDVKVYKIQEISNELFRELL